MANRLKSTVRRVANSVKHSSISDFRDTIRAARPTIGQDESYGSNEYIHRQFFDDDNYNAILKCLDGGHDISKDLLDYMEGYCTVQRHYAQQLTSYTNKWKSKLKGQSSLSSYHTTKRAQTETISAPESVAELIQARCEAIELVIKTYRPLVERMYPTSHKHSQTDRLKKEFKKARSVVSKVVEELTTLRAQEKRAQDALHNAEVQCENLSFDVSASTKKKNAANDEKEKKQDELDLIKDRIVQKEKTHEQDQQNYREKAMEIYNECRELEEERLNQIQETLIQFNQAVHTAEHSSAHDQIYTNLLAAIKDQQDTAEDLDFWARTYHVTKSISSETATNDESNESRKTKKSLANSTTTTDGNPLTVVNENDEADTTTTQAKVKSKKNKKNTNGNEPTTPNATESG